MSRYLAGGVGSGAIAGIAARLREHPPEAEARAAWVVIGEAMTWHFVENFPGRRPFGFWVFVAQTARPEKHVDALAYLQAHGLLEDGEFELAQEAMQESGTAEERTPWPAPAALG
jgi:hypothetical protein